MKSIFVCTAVATVMFFLLYRISPDSDDNHSVPTHRVKIDCHRSGHKVNLTVTFTRLIPGIDVGPTGRLVFLRHRLGDKVNLTVTFIPFIPGIDVDPTDRLVFLSEGSPLSLFLVPKEQLKRSKMEMVIYDKNHDGFVSFSEYGPFQYADGDNDMRLLEEEHFDASDVDGDGLLNLTEFNDFLHPGNSNNPKLRKWLCKAELRESDTDRDGKVSFKEFFFGLYDSVRLYDEKSYNDSHHSDDSMDASARVLFSQLDKDGNGYLSDIELLPIIGKLHPSGQHYYAKKQAEYLISQAGIDKDGHLNLTAMIQHADTLFDAIFYYDDEYEYEDEDEYHDCHDCHEDEDEDEDEDHDCHDRFF